MSDTTASSNTLGEIGTEQEIAKWGVMHVAGSALKGNMAEVRIWFALAMTMTSTILSGVTACVINEPDAPTRGVVVNGPPPAPLREERGADVSAPSSSSVWVTGYWHWTGVQYAWIPSHWDAPPPNSAWSAPVYTQREGRFVYESGSWKPAKPTSNALR